MQHEVLLLALGICDPQDEQEPPSGVLLGDLHPAERDLVAGFVRLGSLSTKLQRLIDKYRLSNAAISPYWRSFGSVAESYHAAFVAKLALLEEQCLSTSTPLALSYMASELEDHAENLAALVFYDGELAHRELDGGKYLSYLHSAASHCANPARLVILRSLLANAHLHFFSYLQLWMLHGRLPSPPHRFFIRRSLLSDADGGEVFSIDQDELPVYISGRVAEKCLFAGRAQQLLLRAKAQADQQELDAAVAPVSGSRRDSQPAPAPRPPEEKSSTEDWWALLRDALCSADRGLELIQLEHAIEQIRLRTAGDLWRQIYQANSLPLHLNALKSYFLVAKGDFYSSFIEDSSTLFNAPAGSNFLHDASLLFQQSAIKTSARDDEMFSRINLARREGSDWRSLFLEYNIESPLDFFVSPDLITKYRSLFPLLFLVRARQLGLHKAWANLAHRSKKLRHDPAPLHRLLVLRNKIGHFVDTFAYYLQVELVEAEYAKMINVVTTCQDYDTAATAHSSYLETLMSQSFVNSKLREPIEGTLQVAGAFCALIDGGAADLVQITRLEQDFDRQHGLLSMMLSRVHQGWALSLYSRLTPSETFLATSS